VNLGRAGEGHDRRSRGSLRTRAPKSLAVVVTVVVAWGLVWVSRPRIKPAQPISGVSSSPQSSASALGSNPLPMGNGLSQCAWTDGWAGYASSRTYYPPNYPQPPAHRVSPSRCFGTPTEAVIAGYRPAPTPSGYLLVGDIYLEPAGQALARACAKAARELGFAVPCPTFVPTSWPGTAGLTCPSSGDPAQAMCSDGPIFHLSQGLIYGPPDLFLHDCCGGELLVTAYEGAGPSAQDISSYYFCSAPVGRSTMTVGSYVAKLLHCPTDYSLESGDLILRFKRGPVTVDVAIAGDGQRALDIILAVAQHIRFVPPR